MEIFDRQYYPANLTDWWLDDWISRVYGEARTRKSQSVEVYHHADQTRYTVNHETKAVLQPLVNEGQSRIDHWVQAHEKSQ